MTGTKVVAGAALLAVLAGVVFTQEPAPPKKDKPATSPAKKEAPPSAKPAVHKVEKKPFRIELTLKGILEPGEAAEVAYRQHPFVNPPPSQGPVTIRKIAEHGSKVQKGDVLAVFDTRKLDEVIQDLESELKVSEAGIKVAEEDLPLFQKSVPVELDAAERGHKRAQEDLKYFLEVGRPEAEKEIDYLVKVAAFRLEYAKEELRQLEKMYKANDLTEDTEQIILRRQRQMVEMAAYWLRSMEIERSYVLKVTLPRRDRDLRDGLVKQTQLLEKARNTLAPQAVQKRESLARMRHDRAKLLTRLETLRGERDALTVRAPIDGIVYHGKFHKGQWSLSGGEESKLAVDGTVSPGDVFLTVVKARPLAVRLTVGEKDVYLLKPGLEGKAKVLYNPDRKLTARVTGVSPIPVVPGKYEAVVSLDAVGDGPELMPGMGCSVKFVPYSRKDALAVPAGAVEEEDDRHFVTVFHKGGKKEKREVTTGRSHGGQTEILTGLRVGEEVLLTPADKTKGDEP
jgi:multidrug efflux pump subunit AcrA (membrane-fusion protein)